MSAEFGKIRHHITQLLLGMSRPLKDVECHLLQCLTAQGIAKINVDLSKGISFENTLRDLSIAFIKILEQRKEIDKMVSSLSDHALELLESMERRPLLDEVWMLLSRPVEGPIERNIKAHLDKGDSVSDVLEDIALRYRWHIAHMDVERVAMISGKCAAVSHLCPTELPSPCPFPLADTMMAKIRSGNIQVGPSPSHLWFDEIAMDQPVDPKVWAEILPSVQEKTQVRNNCSTDFEQSGSVASSSQTVSEECQSSGDNEEVLEPIFQQTRTKRVHLILPDDSSQLTH